MSDARRMLSLLQEYQELGLHSLDVRGYGVSGNPSQRAKDLVDLGYGIVTKRERRGKRNGSRYWLRRFGPADAKRVRGNREHDVEGGDGHFEDATVVSPGAAGGGDSPSPAPPGAAPTVEPVRLVADYTDPAHPSWYTEPFEQRELAA